MSDELIGKNLDDFTIDGVLGKGGMGVVYSATEKGLDRHVAIKVLPDNLAENKSFISRFHREAKSVAKLNHPNVVTIFRVGQTEGRHYIAMEHIQGGDLKEKLTKEGSLPFEKAIEYTRQAASALSAAHSMGILHRDIKPQNIMLDEHDRVKVMDFGIAKLLTPDEDVTSLTMDGALLGTPTHMSTEQCEGLEIDQRADIYALGVVLFQCLTGDVPLKGETPLVVITKILSEEVPDVRTVRKEVPASLAEVLKKATAKNRDDRYATAAAFEQDLAACQKIIESGGSEDTFIRHIGLQTKSKSKMPLFIVVGVILVALVGFLLAGLNKESAVSEEGELDSTPPAEKEVVVREVVTQVVHEVVTPRPVAVVEEVAAPGAPERPQGVVASSGGLRKVLLRWVAPVDAPAKFQIERALNEQGPFIPLERVAPSSLQYVDRGTAEDPLEDNSNYYYRIYAISSEGVKSLSSSVLDASTAPRPEAPQSLEAMPTSSRCIRLKWSASESKGVKSYRIERSLLSDTLGYEFLVETEDTFYQDGGTASSDLLDDSTYLYRIQAINAVGSEGVKSEPIQVTTLPPPHAVKGIAVESDEVRCIQLHWDMHTDENIVGYAVWGSDAQDGEYGLLKNLEGRESIAFLHGKKNPGDLEDDKTYFYKVFARNSIGVESLESKAVSGHTRPVPPIVEGLEGASERPREVPLSWSKSSDEKVVGYEIWRFDTDAEEFKKIADVPSGAELSYIDRGEGARSKDKLGRLTDATSYQYRIAAYNTAHAVSEFSEPITVATKRAPEAPHLVFVSSNELGKIILKWDANEEKDISVYEIESSSRSNKMYRVKDEVDAEVLEYVHEGLSNGMKQYYRIRALDEEGLGSTWSEVLIGATKPLPEKPTELSVAYEKGGATLNWTPSTTEDVQRYKIWKKTMLIKWKLQGESESTTHAFMRDDLSKSGVFAVTAVSEDGLESERSESISIRAAE